MSFEPVEADNVLTPEQHTELKRRQNIGKGPSGYIPQSRRIMTMDEVLQYEEKVLQFPRHRLRPFDSKEGVFKSLNEAIVMFDQMNYCPMCARRMLQTALQQKSKGCMEHVLYYIDETETGGYELWFVPLF